VEPDRKLRLATTRDISSGEVNWQGSGVINPYAEDGPPGGVGGVSALAAVSGASPRPSSPTDIAPKSRLPSGTRRLTASRPPLASKPKLLIPDIKGDAHIVYEPGGLYPHHNLYYITTDTWDLRALQAVLLSEVTRLFIATYSTRMRGGYLRFQAQYLRRIRLPQWSTVEPGLRERLSVSARNRDLAACNAAAFELYELTDDERSILGDGES
jgi:hypothetical protein